MNALGGILTKMLSGALGVFSGGVSWLLQFLITWAVEYISKKISQEIEEQKRIQKIRDENEALRKKLEAAQTEQERADATEDIANNSF